MDFVLLVAIFVDGRMIVVMLVILMMRGFIRTLGLTMLNLAVRFAVLGGLMVHLLGVDLGIVQFTRQRFRGGLDDLALNPFAVAAAARVAVARPAAIGAV